MMLGWLVNVDTCVFFWSQAFEGQVCLTPEVCATFCLHLWNGGCKTLVLIYLDDVTCQSHLKLGHNLRI